MAAVTPHDPEVLIRPATMADSPALRCIRNGAIRNSLAIWTAHEASEAESRSWLAPAVERGTAFVATVPIPDGGAADSASSHPGGVAGSDGVGEEVLGFAVASPWHHYEGYARTVEDSIYLSPAAQGRGIGPRLLAALMEACRERGDRTMIAMIESGNAASVHIHARAGFTTVGTIAQAGEKFGHSLGLTLMSATLWPEA